MCGCVFVSTTLTYMALNALEIIVPYLTVSTCIVFEATVYRVEFSHLITLYTVLCKSHKHNR